MKKKFLLLVLSLVLSFSLIACNQKTEKVEEAHEHHEEHDHDHEHSHGEFEWIGEFDLKAGDYILHFGASPDETMKVAFVKLGTNIEDLEHHAAHVMDTEAEEIKEGSSFEAKPDYAYTLLMDPEHGHFGFTIAEDGTYAIVTEHMPSENNLQVFDSNKVEILPSAEHEGHGHHH